MKDLFAARIRAKMLQRRPVQILAALLNNLYLPGFYRAELYKGWSKEVCAPGLNCYSCPAAVASCPVGSIQILLATPRGDFPYYIVGWLGLIAVTSGRFTCGWLCPFGLLQELIYLVPGKKYALAPILRLVKYFILTLLVVAVPIFIADSAGFGILGFCRYLCPAGTLEAGIPFITAYNQLWDQAGPLFAVKIMVLAGIIAGSALIFRPFCRIMCPLGAIYSLFNRVSLLQIEHHADVCMECGHCAEVCKMGVNIIENPHSMECIRCYECINQCPGSALEWRFRFH